MNREITKWLLIILPFLIASCIIQIGQSQDTRDQGLRLVRSEEILTGALQTELYFNLLKGKSLGLVCNHTSIVEGRHLVDTLLAAGFHIRALFSPEHGFRGDSGAGDLVNDDTDPLTGIPVISLYGNKKKPDPADMQGIEMVIFDMQDVGVRFYTYISTLTLVMEACAENGIPMLVLDRPNPNSFYIDGPVLDTSLRSYVGMHPVPIVYGMTIGEYALMVNGEGWLKDGVKCDLTVIPLKRWDRSMIVQLPVSPSPNLPTWQSVYLYPSLCLFEGTVISVGRGTEYPFQLIGHPGIKTGSYSFTPVSLQGVAESPLYMNQACQGQILTGAAENFQNNAHHFTLSYLAGYYRELELNSGFFNNYFVKLAGTEELKGQIMSGISEEEIRNSWASGLSEFKTIRKKYLIYLDKN